MGEPTIEDQPVDGQPPPLTFEVIEGASKGETVRQPRPLVLC